MLTGVSTPKVGGKVDLQQKQGTHTHVHFNKHVHSWYLKVGTTDPGLPLS